MLLLLLSKLLRLFHSTVGTVKEVAGGRALCARLLPSFDFSNFRFLLTQSRVRARAREGLETIFFIAVAKKTRNVK